MVPRKLTQPGSIPQKPTDTGLLTALGDPFVSRQLRKASNMKHRDQSKQTNKNRLDIYKRTV